MIYGSFSKGFKAGGFSGTTPEIFEPEKVKAYEIGLKGRFFDRALMANIALFLNNYSNLQEASQILLSNGASRAVIGNSAGSRSKGIELNSSLRISGNLSLRGDVSYLDARYTDYRNAPCTTFGGLTPNCVQDLSGRRRAFAPEWSGSIGATLTAPLRNIELRVEPTVSFSSSYKQQSFDPLYSQPAFAKIDLRVGIEDADHGWSLALIGRNLTNKATASFRNVVPTSPGSIVALPDRARSVAIQFTINS